MRHRRARAQGGAQERRLRDLLARGARLLRVAGVDVETVRTLGGAGHRERDQLAILARELAVVPPDDAVELDEPLELRWGELLELPQDLQVIRIVIVAHRAPPVSCESFTASPAPRN